MSKTPTFYRAVKAETGDVVMIKAVSKAQAREHLLKRTWSLEVASKDDLGNALANGIKLEDATATTNDASGDGNGTA